MGFVQLEKFHKDWLTSTQPTWTAKSADEGKEKAIMVFKMEIQF
jgi:hypothetical protein